MLNGDSQTSWEDQSNYRRRGVRIRKREQESFSSGVLCGLPMAMTDDCGIIGRPMYENLPVSDVAYESGYRSKPAHVALQLPSKPPV